MTRTGKKKRLQAWHTTPAALNRKEPHRPGPRALTAGGTPTRARPRLTAAATRWGKGVPVRNLVKVAIPQPPTHQKGTDMTQDELDAMNGRIAALSMTLTALIQALPALGAAEAAVLLKMDQEATRQADAEDGTPAAEARSRDMIVDSYLQLLSAVAR